LGPVRILIVDDFESWRRTIRSILVDDSNLEVIGECSDGLDAVRKSEELRPDLVLLDIQLPGVNGFVAAQRIVKSSPDTKILFLTTYKCLELMQEALGIGAGLIMKADAGQHLLPAIRAIVRNEPFLRVEILDKNSPNSDDM
jgi:DNA-binding NarL/FixJ family response regulator